MKYWWAASRSPHGDGVPRTASVGTAARLGLHPLPDRHSVHGGDYIVTDRSVDVQIVGLRKKLGEAAAYIETIRGVGYRFKE